MVKTTLKTTLTTIQNKHPGPTRRNGTYHLPYARNDSYPASVKRKHGVKPFERPSPLLPCGPRVSETTLFPAIRSTRATPVSYSSSTRKRPLGDNQEIMRLDCERCCVLRPWAADDEPSLVRHANNHKVWRSLRDSFPHPYTPADAQQWIDFVQRQSPQTFFAIEVGGKAVGGVGLELQGDIERLSAEIGYWLGEAFWGKGIATAAVRALSTYGFKELGLRRIFAVPLISSRASMRVLEKAGYTREGVLRRSAIKEGVVFDQVLYALTDIDVLPFQRSPYPR